MTQVAALQTTEMQQKKNKTIKAKQRKIPFYSMTVAHIVLCRACAYPWRELRNESIPVMSGDYWAYIVAFGLIYSNISHYMMHHGLYSTTFSGKTAISRKIQGASILIKNSLIYFASSDCEQMYTHLSNVHITDV